MFHPSNWKGWESHWEKISAPSARSSNLNIRQSLEDPVLGDESFTKHVKGIVTPTETYSSRFARAKGKNGGNIKSV